MNSLNGRTGVVDVVLQLLLSSNNYYGFLSSGGHKKQPILFATNCAA